MSHHEHYYTLGLNQNAVRRRLLCVRPHPPDARRRRPGDALDGDRHDDDAYGLMTMNGEPTPACLAKQLFAQHVRYGDWIRFPRRRPENARRGRRRRLGRRRPPQRRVRQYGEPAAPGDRLRLGHGAAGLPGGAAARHRAPATGWSASRSTGRSASNGYGVAVVTNAASGDRGSTETSAMPRKPIAIMPQLCADSGRRSLSVRTGHRRYPPALQFGCEGRGVLAG